VRWNILAFLPESGVEKFHAAGTCYRPEVEPRRASGQFPNPLIMTRGKWVAKAGRPDTILYIVLPDGTQNLLTIFLVMA